MVKKKHICPGIAFCLCSICLRLDPGPPGGLRDPRALALLSVFVEVAGAHQGSLYKKIPWTADLETGFFDVLILL